MTLNYLSLKKSRAHDNRMLKFSASSPPDKVEFESESVIFIG